ncbi:MAG: hypothetical protein M1816_003244 [Peltula sp. TS41687]|nr:MAG: hypothetical protein M1816_003244 [Peltula sp. TS41687]
MALSIEEAWQAAEAVEKLLHAKLGEKDPTFQEIDHLLTQSVPPWLLEMPIVCSCEARYRTTCENVLFLDFEFATRTKVEARLWDIHSRINNRFRSSLSRVMRFQFQGDQGKKKIVERRKLIKHYLDFIKSSQRFYRAYIQRLASHFGGIPELDEVAHRFKWDDERNQSTHVESTPALRHSILVSCYQTLVRLGDLSRYRESELTVKDRNWGPATGYYDLASTLYPDSGMAQNQLAVIALADGNHLRATYHLYRALAVEEPYPSAKGNLEIEFKKIVAAWRKGELISKSAARDGNAGKTLSAWFVLLHARCYKGEQFAEHEELENEFLSRLTIDLKERSLNHALNRFILINISAEYFAGLRVQDAPESKENYQAFFSFLRLNVKTFTSLLQILQMELDRPVTNDNRSHDKNGGDTKTEKIKPGTRRVLPGLRNYSSWLVSNSALLVAGVGDESLCVQIKEMWRTYATSLTLLAATFPAVELPLNTYLLEEDVDTLGFKPFTVDRVRRRYQSDGGQRKPRYYDAGINRNDEDTEMLGRVREILTEGLELVVDQSIPIELVNGVVFTYQREGVPSELLASPNGATELAVGQKSSIQEPIQAIDINGSRPVDITPRKTNAGHHGEETIVHKDDTPFPSIDNSEPASLSMSAAMNHMVDSLVGPDDSYSTTPHPSSTIITTESMMPPPPAPAPSTRQKTSTPPPPPPPPPPTTTNRLTSLPTAGNETTFYPGAPGTLTAAELVNMVHNYSSQPKRPSPAISHQSTPRLQSSSSPALFPSIWNTPFAPQPTDSDLGLSLSFPAPATPSSSSRPGTAHRSSPQQPSMSSAAGSASKRTSLHQQVSSSSSSNHHNNNTYLPPSSTLGFPAAAADAMKPSNSNSSSSNSWSFTAPGGGGRAVGTTTTTTAGGRHHPQQQFGGRGNGNDNDPGAPTTSASASYEAIMAMEPLWSQSQYWARTGVAGGGGGRYGMVGQAGGAGGGGGGLGLNMGMGVGVGGMTTRAGAGGGGGRGMGLGMVMMGMGLNHGNGNHAGATPPPGQGG